MKGDEFFEHIVHSHSEKMPDAEAINQCIYCRAKRPDSLLTREHVIPDGIGGILVLPEASCTECASTINKFEQPIIKSIFGMTRYANNISAKNKKRPRKYKSEQNYKFFERLVSEKEIDDRIKRGKYIEGEREDFTSTFNDAIILESYGEFPGILEGKPPGYEGNGFKAVFSGTPGRSESSPGSLSIRIQLGRFERFLAKIAHGYAVHALGIDGFKPYLTDYILEEKDVKSNRYLIGSGEANNNQVLHYLSLCCVNAKKIIPPMVEPSYLPVVVCDIHLFSYIAPIAYRVVVGEPC